MDAVSLSAISLQGREGDNLRVEKKRTGKPETGASPGSPAAERGAKDDAVYYSEYSRQLQRLTAAAATLPELRSERVQHLQRQIRDGALSLNAEAVADAIFREEESFRMDPLN